MSRIPTYYFNERTLLHRAARVPSVTERAMIYRCITCDRATPQDYVWSTRL